MPRHNPTDSAQNVYPDFDLFAANSSIRDWPFPEEKSEPVDWFLKVACVMLFSATVVVALLGDLFVDSLNYVLNV